MKVLIFGATGKTGSLTVDAALAAGHEVSVLVRDPAKFARSGVRVFTGDATKASDVAQAMPGQQAVIQTIGGTTPYKATTLESSSVKNILAGMKSEGVPRLIVVTMMGIGDSREQAPFWYRYLLMHTFLRGSTPDKARVEEAVTASGLEYVIVRPPILDDGPATGTAEVIGNGRTGHKITRSDLAAFLVAQLTSDRYLRQAVTVVNS